MDQFEFNYLKINKAKIPDSTWLYAIHGKNDEIIQFLQKKKNVKIKNFKTFQCYLEWIKCHHDDIVNAFQNIIQKSSSVLKSIFKIYIKCTFQFLYIPKKVIIILIFFISSTVTKKRNSLKLFQKR